MRKQAAINSIGSFVLLFAQWLISVLIVRMGGYTDAGIFSLGMSISNVFSFFANFGIRNFQVSDAKREFSPTQYIEARITTVIASFAVCVAYLLVAGGYSVQEKSAILLYLFYSNVNVLSDVLMGTLQVRGQLYINGYSNIIKGISCLIAFLGVYFISQNVICALLVMAIVVSAVTIGYDIRIYTKHENINFGCEDTVAVKKIIRKCIPLMISTVLPVLVTAVPRRAIQLTDGTEILGYFSSVFAPTVVITTLIPAITVAYLPMVAKAWSTKNKLKLKKIIICFFLGIISVTEVAECAAIIAGEKVMVIVFGNEIRPYYPVMYSAILATGLNALTGVGNGILTSLRKNRLIAISAFVPVLITALLSSFMVQKYSIWGASYILIIAYGTQSIIQFLGIVYFIWRKDTKYD